MNQMGDILASKGKDSEAAEYYREAAALFFSQGDMYNESHAREGLYKTLKRTAPDEAMLHLERAKQLRDSIYQKQTGESISRYNALYHNDLLQKEAERAKQTRHIFLLIAFVLLGILVLFGIGAWVTYLRSKRKEHSYEQDIHSLQTRYNEINRLYRNIAIESVPNLNVLTDDDRTFMEELTRAIDEEMENGHTDLKSVSSRMHTTEQTLRRRLTKTLGVTPQVYFTQVRMKKAKYLLLNYRDITISEVAEKCGYTLMTNFTRAFARYYGIKPSEVRLQKPDTEFTTPPAKGGITGENKPSQTQ
jgi:AraC-like DNA-binding protein